MKTGEKNTHPHSFVTARFLGTNRVCAITVGGDLCTACNKIKLVSGFRIENIRRRRRRRHHWSVLQSHTM